MQKTPPYRQSSSGAKAIAIDLNKTFARYRLYMLITLIIAAVSALGLHLIFAR